VNAIVLYRLARRLHLKGVPVLPRLLFAVTFLVFNSELHAETEIGPGTTFDHGGTGVIIHPRAVIGSGVLIGPQVTIGGRSGLPDLPVIEDDVYIGNGAKVLGPVRVGRGAKIGANAVVIKDVPAGATAVGVPARIVQPSGSSPAAA
jgi:serine O-acetyltransferase